ncbi:MAG: PAS domain-containing protein [Pyrinomonadaceae bacterium]|nr:PAS domain-containing protein [Pyrinomonadaceae bacterium]
MPVPDRAFAEDYPGILVWASRIAFLFGLYALIGGLISFIGWSANIKVLTDWEGSGVSIQPLTTVAAGLCGVAVILTVLGAPRAAGAVGGAVAVIGLSSIIQTAAGIDLGVDALLMFGHEWGRTGTLSPGRMGIAGALSWTLLGGAFIFFAVGRGLRDVTRSLMANQTAVGMAMAAMAISMLSLIGYIYGAKALYSLPRSTIIAIQTSSFIFATAAGLVLCLRNTGPMKLFGGVGPGSSLARQIIPVVLLIPIILGFVNVTAGDAALYDSSFGSALRTLLEIGVMTVLVFLTAHTINLQAERTRTREREMRQLADAMPQVVWVAGPDGEVVYYNAQVAGFGGIDPEANTASDRKPSIHADDVAGARASWDLARSEQRPYASEHRTQMADGSYRWHLSRAFPTIGADGKIEKWFGTTTDIHDIKIAEGILRESEQKFVRFMHRLPGLAWIKDADGRYVYANDAAMKAFRMSKALYGRTDAEIFPIETATSFEANDRLAVESSSGVQSIESLEDDDGALRQLLVSRFPIDTADGQAPMIGGVAIDITAERQMQSDREFLFAIAEKIRTSGSPEDLMAHISRSLGEYLALHRCFFNEIDTAADIETVNDGFARDGKPLTGTYAVSTYSPITSDEMSRGITVINHDASFDERTSSLFDTVYGPSKELAYVAVPILHDGSWVASLWCSDDKPRKWKSHEIELLENVAERTWSAVERSRANTRLRSSDERFRLAQEAGSVGIWDLDILAGRTYWSEQMWSLYGEDQSSAAPDIQFWRSHLHPEDAERAVETFEHSLASGAERHHDVFRIVRSEDEIRWIESIATIVRDKNGQAIRTFGVNLDITGQKAHEDELQRAHDQLEHRVELRTRELADVNTQLHEQIQELARSEDHRVALLKRLFTIQEDERGRIARDIHDQLGQRLTALRLKIASIIDLCDKGSPVFERVSRLLEISELLDSEVSFLAWELHPTVLDEEDFNSTLDQYVREWSRFSGISAEVDQIALRGTHINEQVATNLYRITQEALNNVAKYSKADLVNVLLEKRGSDLILIVEDNGIGFEISTSEQNDAEQRGFGLLSMRERAALISGTLDIESEPGHGTTIFVRVPLSDNGETS